MAFDFAKAVIDNEISLMMKRLMRGFEFTEDNLALDLIAEVGPGGMFAGEEHTLERMRTAMLLTEIADRDPRQQWEERGALDAQARAMQRVKDILTRDNPAVFAPDVDARIRTEFAGMVAGDSHPPQGWKKVSPSTEEEADTGGRRRRRRRRQRT
jgi:trimethylamine--corrinoid protein Co-methyltransferase